MYYKNIQIAPDTWYVREILGVGSYLFIGKDKALLSDTGNGFRDITKPLSKICNKPLILMNTHGHSDHVGGNSRFGEVFIHEADIHMLEEAWQKAQRDLMWGYAREKYPITRLFLNALEKKLPQHKDIEVMPLADGHIFSLGGREIKAVFFPGHSPGSTLLIDEVTETLYAGDAINPGLFLFFRDCPSLKDYALRLRELNSKLAEMGNLKWIRGSHSKDAIPISFISYLADFLDRASVNESRVTDFPNFAPVLQYRESAEGYPFKSVSVFYCKENQK